MLHKNTTACNQATASNEAISSFISRMPATFNGTEPTNIADCLKYLYPGLAEVRIITRRLYSRPIYTIRVFTSPELGTVRVAHARSRNPLTAAMRIIDRIDNDPDFSRRAGQYCIDKSIDSLAAEDYSAHIRYTAEKVLECSTAWYE